MWFRSFIAVVLCTSALSAPAGNRERDQDFTISAAVSLRDVLNEASKLYLKQSGSSIQFNFGASGELATQIQQGAPVDLFISAAQKQVDDLIESGEVDKNAARAVIARNALVLIVPAGAKDAPTKFEDLVDLKLAPQIAIGEPKSVPAGQYAMEVFDAMKITDLVRDRLQYASNVRQVLAYVERGEASAGVVYQTDAMFAADKVKIVAVAHEKLHTPIEYPAVVIKGAKNAAAAEKFVKFLQSEKVKAIFKAKGFITP